MHDVRNGSSHSNIPAKLLHAVVVAAAATGTYLSTHDALWAGAVVFFATQIAGVLLGYLPPRKSAPRLGFPGFAPIPKLPDPSEQGRALRVELQRRQRAVHDAIHDWLNVAASVRGVVDLSTTEMQAILDHLEAMERESSQADKERPAP